MPCSRAYDAYIHEIIIVDDNSTDSTAAVVAEATAAEPRVRLIRRSPPNGVGRALRDGYAAATGRYILTMDCDFVLLVPELRDLFDRVAAGREGAIGSRFSYESVLINYPFFKILCNRAFHLLVKLTLLGRVRDVSNNLKLYRADILKTLDIEEPHFAANMETGLKPLARRLRPRRGAGVLDQQDGRHGRLVVPHRQGGSRLSRSADAHDLARVARAARLQQAAGNAPRHTRPGRCRAITGLCTCPERLFSHGRRSS